MTNKVIITLVAVMLISSMAGAQVANPDQNRASGFKQDVFGLGIAAGAASGLGVSFRHHLRTAFSYQITGGIIKADEQLYYDIGGEAQYDMSRGAETRFFLVGGLGYYYSGKGKNELKAPARVGIGAGAEVGFAGSWGASGELLFTYFTDGTILPLPQLAVYYYF
jgi:hypothetical protein